MGEGRVEVLAGDRALAALVARLTPEMIDLQQRLMMEYRTALCSWELDQESGELIFSDASVAKVVARIQYVGSWSAITRRWRWSWDNPTILPRNCAALEQVREYGRQHGLQRLTTGSFAATSDEVGLAMTAVSMKLLGGVGMFRTGGAMDTFVVCTEVGWARPMAA
jgi:hypothetical protein